MVDFINDLTNLSIAEISFINRTEDNIRVNNLMNKWKNSINLIKNLFPEFANINDNTRDNNYNNTSDNNDNTSDNDYNVIQHIDQNLFKYLIIQIKQTKDIVRQDQNIINMLQVKIEQDQDIMYMLQVQNKQLKTELNTSLTELNKYKNNEICDQSSDADDDDKQCSVCFTKPKDHINTSCGHMSVCMDCCHRISGGTYYCKCPICRNEGVYIRVIS